MKTRQSPHLTEYYYVLVKHKSLIIASLAITVTLTLLFTFLMKPVYRSTTTMLIEKEQTTSPLTGERLDYESYLSQSLTFNTHFKLITSRPVSEQVINALKLDRLDREKAFGVNPVEKLVSWFANSMRLIVGKEKKVPTPEEKLAELIEKLQEKIDIEEVRDTRLLKVSVENNDPVLARDIANALAMGYVEFNVASRLSSSENTLGWMTNQLHEIKQKLENAEAEFQAYKQEEQLFSVEGKQKIITQKIENFNDAYVETRNKRLELDAKLAELRKTFKSEGDILHARSIVDNPVIDSLYTQLLDAEVELTGISKVFKSKHPKSVQVRSKIDKTRKKLDEELKKEIENLKAERSVVVAKENVLQKTIADFENDALETSRKELKYAIYKRNVDTNQKLYDTLLSRIKECNILGNLDASNIRISEEATVPLRPVKPQKTLNLVLSVIFGLMTGTGFCFLREYLDRSLRTEEDVERHLELPVLSVIPVADSSSCLFVNDYPTETGFGEAYRALRTNIHFALIEKKMRSVLITSSLQDEGKTTAVANLGYTMSCAGKSVLMVDADLRKQALSRIIPSRQSPGLTGLLSDLFVADLRKGALEDFSTSDLFRLIRLQKRTGTLRVSDGKEEVRSFFLQGEMVDLNWVTRPEEKKLAHVLVKSGLLTDEQAARSIDRQKGTGQKLGFMLINMGMLKEDDLKGPLVIHMMEGLRIALQIKTGGFDFKELPESDFDRSSFDPVDLHHLYKQAILGKEELPYLQRKINSAIVETAAANLFLLPAGNLPPNPSELLGSDGLSFLMSNLQKRFDLLIIDSSPVLSASDALMIAPQTDGVILMVKAGLVNREMVKKAVEQITSLQAGILGVVLNEADVKSEGYYRQ